MNIALNAEFNLRPLGIALSEIPRAIADKAEPMDLSHVCEKVELQFAEQQRHIRRYTRVKTRGTFAPAARCESNDKIGRIMSLPQA